MTAPSISPLADTYGDLLIVRPPVPATVNKAGANYKSEVTHLTYSPRGAYDEWLAILDGILACGGDALYQHEAVDDRFLDHAALRVDGDGAIRADDGSEVLGNLADVHTGRVFAANGPWMRRDGQTLRAALPHMLPHRRAELGYYRDLLAAIGDAAGLAVDLVETPHRWEGMADVAVVGDQVVLTYAVAGHYDQGIAAKSPRSSREGVAFAADTVGVPEDARIYAELVYPHFHGDTVHFGARPTAPGAAPVLAHYAGGLWGDGAAHVAAALGPDRVVPIDRADAVDAYAGNSRQVRDGVLVPAGVSPAFVAAMRGLGLAVHSVALHELFGKAGGGPACATLYVPRGVTVPAGSPLRYSQQITAARARRDRLPAVLTVDRSYFDGKTRG